MEQMDWVNKYALIYKLQNLLKYRMKELVGYPKRVVEIYDGDYRPWKKLDSMMQLCYGDIFRLVCSDPDDYANNYIYIARSEGYINSEGTVAVNCEVINK